MPNGTELSGRKISLLSRMVGAIVLWLYKRAGWTSFGDIPESRKFVILAVPHTSNWDFVNLLGLTHDLGIKVNFMAKQSLFRWPIGNFMRDMGGVSVNRSSSTNVVQQMADEFEKRDEFMLTIAAEGTRGSVKEWKSGFYHIAVQAGVPIVVGMMDYKKKTGGFVTVIEPSGDYEADMKQIVEYYRSVTPRHPDKSMKHFS